MGQHFLVHPTLARRIAEVAGVGPESRVLEVGAGLGSLTLALASTGARVVAVELDRALLPALREVVAPFEHTRVVRADAVTAEWGALLAEPGPWILVANLPYNVAVPVVLRVVEHEPRVERLVVMVQREVGERLVSRAGGPHFGPVSLRVAYRMEARIVRRVPPTAFWPRPGVESVLVAMTRRPAAVTVSEADLWRLVEVAFEQRRKTIRTALVRLGLSPADAEAVLSRCEVSPASRPQTLDLEAFACLAAHGAALMPPDARASG